MAISPTNASRCRKKGDFEVCWEGWVVDREAMLLADEKRVSGNKYGMVETVIERGVKVMYRAVQYRPTPRLQAP